jgi:uncharacterized protein YkwD
VTSGTALAGALHVERGTPAETATADAAGAAASTGPAGPAGPTGTAGTAGTANLEPSAAAGPATTSAAPAITAPPTTTTAPRPTTTTPPARTTEQQRVVDLVNAERAKAGCRALIVDQRLVAAAQAHSTDMAVNDYFSHTSPDGSTFADRIRAAGYPSPGAENIAKGYRSADEVMAAWMRSKGHRANILDCTLTAIGVGLDTRGSYWTQDFGR